MVMETMEEFEEFDGIEFRDYDNNEPRVMSVSAYGELQSKAAHDALVQASENLLPLADYIEQSYSPEQDLQDVRINGEFSNDIGSLTLYGGETLLQGGDYMIQAVNAVACNVAALAESFNDKLMSLDEDVKRLTHEVEVVESTMKINHHRMSLNKVKKLTVKKDPTSMESVGPIVREGDFMANPKYVRKRIDFNLFDDIGHGHKIHATSFNMNPELERQQSIVGGSYDGADMDSTTGSGLSLGRRSSFSSKGSNYLSLGRGGKPSDGRVISKRVTASPMRFPTIPSTFPRAPSAFPVVPESPTLSSISGAPSDGSQKHGLSQQDSFDTEIVEPPEVIPVYDNLDDPGSDKRMSFDLPPPPPPPESPPPDLPPPQMEFDVEPPFNRQEQTISMLPPPEFD